MVKLVSENINSFVRNQDPNKSLGLGYKAKIQNFFDQYNIPDGDYEIKENGEIVFNSDLYLRKANLDELPDNMTINGNLYLNYSNIKKLPNNLVINDSLYLGNTSITELPDDLIIKHDYIYVLPDQTELINNILQSKFKNKLTVC